MNTCSRARIWVCDHACAHYYLCPFCSRGSYLLSLSLFLCPMGSRWQFTNQLY